MQNHQLSAVYLVRRKRLIRDNAILLQILEDMDASRSKPAILRPSVFLASQLNRWFIWRSRHSVRRGGDRLAGRVIIDRIIDNGHGFTTKYLSFGQSQN